MRKVIALTLVVITSAVQAQVTLPKIFGDNMVLQRDRTIFVWGWAAPKEKITVQLNNQTKSIVAGKEGQWKVVLDPEVAGGPHQLIVKGKKSITLNNVLIGDVWICSGQSNMEWPLRSSNDAVEEARVANYPAIRHFKVPNTMASQPQKDLRGGEWKVCTSETAKDFTAVGYFFARELNQELKVPVGLINTSWGGTNSETWTSKEAFESSDEFKAMIAGMPKLDLDSLAKVQKALTIKRIEALQGRLGASPSMIASWKEISFDDSAWPSMKVPDLWEGQDLGDFDGAVWFRKTIQLSASDLGKPATLQLAMIDDSDDAYVNGVRVGGLKQQYNEKRNYNVPSAILKEGENVIAVRVDDTGGGGGIYGDASEVKLTIGNSALTLAGDWRYKVESIMESSVSMGPNSYPSLLYNAMIQPLIPFAIKGAIWYQGESNAGRAYQYRKAFPLLINDWRKQWSQGEFPFYFVQLASFDADHGTSKTGSKWAELREAQTMTLSLSNTGMAVTTDIGDAHDIHPRNKQDVGKRLAAIALNKTYNKGHAYSGPQFKSMEVKGDKVIISFTDTEGGLVARDKYGYLRGFEISGNDQKFYHAKASIEGNTVVVYHADVKNPVAVRFGWADDASENNLYNGEGFPAGPFRTDNWKGITEGQKFWFAR
jgi:sialate O-acetylesterase